jgi:hypothetical protein
MMRQAKTETAAEKKFKAMPMISFLVMHEYKQHF